MMMVGDRANPQTAGIDRLAARVIGVVIADGARRPPTSRHTFLLSPSRARRGPGKDGGAGYDVANHIASATPAGPAGFTARLRAINGGITK